MLINAIKPVGILALGASLALTAAIAKTAAQDASRVCIQCTGPTKSYVCEVDGVASASASALGMYCVLNTAQRRGHDSCAIRKKNFAACDGELIVLNYTGPALPAASRQPEDGTTGAAQADADDPDKTSDTLVGLTGRAVEASKKGLSKAGEKTKKSINATGRVIGDVAKKTVKTVNDAGESAGEAAKKTGRNIKGALGRTWRCIASIFKNC